MGLFLASRRLDALPGFLAEIAAGPRAVFVPAAADRLPDRAEIVDLVRGPLVRAGLEVTDVDLRDGGAGEAAARSDVVVLGAGDPFFLLDRARRRGFGEVVGRAVRSGAAYVGVSAGAVVAGPSLLPVTVTSPFAPRPKASLDGFGLTDHVVLAHADRPGRAARNALALRRYGRAFRLVPLSDDEALVVARGRAEVRNTALRCTFTDAAPADAGPIADTFVEAGRAAWASLLGADRVAAMEPAPGPWARRIAELTPPARIVVATDASGVVGFVWVHPAPGAVLPGGCGEVGALYTRPRAWGRGIGRRLLDRGGQALTAAGCRDAVLWTEERNTRPRAVYERAGWRPDGVVRERDYLGVGLRELRYRLTLTADATGSQG